MKCEYRLSQEEMKVIREEVNNICKYTQSLINAKDCRNEHDQTWESFRIINAMAWKIKQGILGETV